LFSSLTIAAAVASLMVFPQSFLYSMGIAGAIVAVTAATLALTVLPAILTVLGPRVNALAPKRLQRAAAHDARPAEHGFWYRLSHFVMRRPAPIAIASAALLMAGQTRSVGARRSLPLRIADRLATVPGLAVDHQRISTNHRISRFLEVRHPEPPLFPVDSQHRSAVEEAERWATDTLQMDARRIVTGAVRRDPSAQSALR
jgi:hypothetical protein